MRYLRNTGIVLSGIAIIIMVILAVMAIIFHNLLNAQLAKLNSSGKYSTLADFMPIKVSDDQNAAVIYTQMLGHNKSIVVSSSRKASDADWLHQILVDTKDGVNVELWDEAKTIINRNRKIYEQLDEAVSKPYCVFPIDWSQDYVSLFKYITEFRDWSRFLCAKTMVNARDGKPDYLHSIHTCIKMSESLSNVPDTESQKLRNEILRRICNYIIRSLDYRNMSEQDVIHLRKKFAQINLKQGLALALKRERLLTLLMQPDEASWYIGLRPPPPSDINSFIDYTYDSIFRSFVMNVGQYGDKASYLEYMNNLINSIDHSYKEFVAQGLTDPKFPVYAGFCHFFETNYKYQVDRYVTESYLAGTGIVLALHAYRNRYGSYPSNLDDLRSKLGWEIPVDPLSGEDYVYRKEGKGFILYSIGEDLKDDSGTIDYFARGSYSRKRGDIIWRLDH